MQDVQVLNQDKYIEKVEELKNITASAEEYMVLEDKLLAREA